MSDDLDMYHQIQSRRSASPEADRPNSFRAVFEKYMLTSRKPIKYESVSVLLLTYDSSDRQYAEYDLQSEVDQLEDVFRQDYDFHVEQEVIKRDQSAHNQMNFHLSKFTLKHEKEHGLIIVYYGGHGWHSSDPRRNIPGSFDLIPRQLEYKAVVPPKDEFVMWEVSEKTLHQAKGDVLVMFDCCDAGALAQLRSSSRAFEYIGACQAGSFTHGPGEKSFTSAMIWALKELSAEEHFTTDHLVAKIQEHEHFPTEQRPVLFSRTDYIPEHIWLSSKPTVVAPKHKRRKLSSAPEFRDENCGYVDFRVTFNRPLSDKDGKVVAEMMAPLVRSKMSLNARHVSVIRNGACHPSGIYAARWTRAWNHIMALNKFQRSSTDSLPLPNQKRKRPAVEAEPEDQSPSKYAMPEFSWDEHDAARLPATPSSQDHDSGSERTIGLRVDTAIQLTPSIVLSPSGLAPSPLERVEALLEEFKRLKQDALLPPELQRSLQEQLQAALAQGA